MKGIVEHTNFGLILLDLCTFVCESVPNPLHVYYAVFMFSLLKTWTA